MSIIKAIMLFLAAKGEYSRDSSTEKDDLHNQDKTDYLMVTLELFYIFTIKLCNKLLTIVKNWLKCCRSKAMASDI